MSMATTAPVPGCITEGRHLEHSLTVRAEVCVVGSGAGGASVACALAEAGREVVILEMGGYTPPEDLGFDTVDLIQRLYRRAGATVIMGSPPIVFNEGSCVGGSTVINGGISWPTPEKVLDRWSREFGVEHVTPSEMEPYFQQVEEDIHVCDQPPESMGRDSELLKEGARKMGWKVSPVRRNQRGACASAHCVFGCPTGSKQSMLVTYLPRALAAGARLIADCRVTKIHTRGGRLTGVSGRIERGVLGRRGPRVRVVADTVVLSCGAPHTPPLLHRNRLCKGSGQLGRNLTVHPNAKVVALFDEQVNGWEGTTQGYRVEEFVEEGIIMATAFLPPGVMAMMMPGMGAELQALMQDYARMGVYGALVEDTTAGTVRPGPLGESVMHYQLTEPDRFRLAKAIGRLAELLFAAGARKVMMPHHGFPFIDSVDAARRFAEAPPPLKDLEVVTVHAMGTCRMGRNRREAPLNSYGESFSVRNLFVSDASVFPTPLGVNPQVSIMALGLRQAAHILDRS